MHGFAVLNINHLNFDCLTMKFSSNLSSENVNVWHSRLAHFGKDMMNMLAREGL